MASLQVRSVNPWEEVNILADLKLSCPENAVVLARQFNLTKPDKDFFEEDLKVVRYIDYLQMLTNLEATLIEVELQLKLTKLELELSPVLSQTVLAHQLKLLKNLINHFSLISTSSSIIRSRLHNNPVAHGCLPVEAPYQRSCIQVFSSMVDLLNNLLENTYNISWNQSGQHVASAEEVLSEMKMCLLVIEEITEKIISTGLLLKLN